MCGDFDGLAWHQRFDTPQGFSHQLLAEPGAAHFRRGHHAAHGCLFVADSGLENARVGNKFSLPIVFFPAEQMPRSRVASIGVRVRAILLDDEDPFAQTHYGVQIVQAQFIEPRPLPIYSLIV